MTIDEIASSWKKEKKKYVRLSSYSTYNTLLETHLLPVFGEKIRVSGEEVQDFVVQKLGEGLSVGTVKETVLVLRMVLRHGARMGVCEKPDWTVRYPCPLRRRDVTVLSNPHCRRILKAVKENPSRKNIGIHICLLTGLRIGEICALRRDDIDLPAGVLHVRRTLSRVYVSDALRPFCKLSLDRPKTDSSVRDIPLEEGLRHSLEAFPWGPDPECYVLSGSHRPIEPRSYRNYFASFLDSLEIPRVNFHVLRHTFATRCIEVGADYKTVSSLLGHSDIKTTLNLYVHPRMSQKQACVNRLVTAPD